MDTEGAELEILRGAATIITRCKPILAISAYHKLDDFWTLMNFIKYLRPDYEFAMRQYTVRRDDVPFFFSDDTENFFYSFGLDTDLPWYGECVLFAR